MSCITIRRVARVGTGIMGLAVALCLTAPGHAQNLRQIDKSTITIFDNFPNYGGYDAFYALDSTSVGTTDQNITDYASLGGGTNTYLSFDFGVPYTFSAILYTDRTTSGGPNSAYFGGTFDYVTSYLLTFSNDMTFETNVGTVQVDLTPPSQPTSVSSFQTLSLISGIPPAQYVRWQVLATNGNNPGAADFAFFGSLPQ